VASRWNAGWEGTSEVYTAAQVEAVLENSDVEIVGETAEVFTCLCPYHGNTDTAAFAVNKRNGTYICFNPACGRSGNLEGLVMSLQNVGVYQAKRIIMRQRRAGGSSFQDRLKEILADEPLPAFPQDIIYRLHSQLWKTPHALEYMHDRGFEDDTLSYFEVGYSNAYDKRLGRDKDMITVPMHDYQGNPVGLVGRWASHTEKIFRNSDKLPKKETLFNLHRARKVGGTVIIVEATFDAMRIHQAGFPGVVAVLGGHISPWHIAQLNRYFDTVIIMTDYDDWQYYPNCKKCGRKCKGHRPGRDLGNQIVEQLRNKKMRWAVTDEGAVFPREQKDACSITDEEIRTMLRNVIPNFKYQQLPLASRHNPCYN